MLELDLAWQANTTGWWGEGEIKFYMDGDQDFPTICGTGTEDYFGGAWNFEHPTGEYGVILPLFGIASGDQARWTLSQSATFRHVSLAYYGPHSF